MSATDRGHIHVLCVDDDPSFADLAATFLEREHEDLAVDVVTDPSDALDSLDGVDCVVSDYQMPEMTGIELLEAVRGERPDLPFILFTGHGSEEVASEAITAGVNDYLRKGTGTERYSLLANRVRNAVHRQRAETSYREIFEKATDGILLHDPETGDIRDANRQMAELLGYERDELLELGVADFSPDEAAYSQEEVRRLVRRAATEGPQVFEWVNVTRDGEQVPVEVHLRRTTIGGREQVLAVVRDVSERTRTQRTLRAIVENSEQAIYVKRPDGRYELMNGPGAALFDAEQEDIVGQRDDALFPAADAERIRRIDREILETEAHRTYESEVTVDGERRVFENHKFPYVSATGEVLGLVGISTDVTERKARERSLEEDRDRASALFENTSDCAVFREYDGEVPVVVDVNPAFEETFGFDRESMIGRSLDEVVVPADEQAEAAALNERAKAGELLETEVRRLTADGPRDFLLRSVPLTPENGTKGYVVYTDITARKEREAELRRYETIVEATGDPVYTLDADGRFTFVNERLAEMAGYDATTLVGEHVSVIMEPGEIERGKQLIRELLESDERERGTYEMELTTADGSTVPTENHIALLPFDDGEFRGTVGVVRDITGRRARERELERQNERLEEFASVVSHDLRNPLNVAQARLDLYRTTDDDEHLGNVDGALTRMEDIVADVLTLARHGRTVDDPETVQAEETVTRAWANVETGDAELRAEFDRTVRADSSRLQQLLENLFANAVEHGGEDVTVTVGELDEAGEPPEIGGPPGTGGFFVADDGPGIPPADRERVFESSYSTAEGGTGFGLSIVESIAEAHGWTVTLTESEAGGARFELSGVEFVHGSAAE